MNSLGLRTEVMLDRLEPLTLLADPTAAKAIWDGWSDLPPPWLADTPVMKKKTCPKKKSTATKPRRR